MKKTSLFGLGIIVLVLLISAGSAEAAWLDSAYGYRQPITLTGGADGVQTDYQIKLAVTYDSDMQADFDDLRFTQSDGTTLIDAWLESKVDSVSAVVWVEFPTTPANGSDQTYYMYYGNSGVSSGWDIADAFVFGDDFPGSSLDTNKWDSSGSIVVSGSEVILNADDLIVAKTAVGLNHVVEARAKSDEQDTMFVSFRESLASDHNSIEMMNSDADYPDDFDRFRLVTKKDGTSTTAYIDGWSDFRNTYYNYRIFRKSSSLVTFQQGSHSADQTADVPTADVKPCLRVWDSSQISTLTSDWVFVRKYVVNPSSYGFGAEEIYTPAGVLTLITNNNVTGANDHVPLAYGTIVLFNATANLPVTWSWTLDGADQGASVGEYTHAFTDGFGYYAVTVTATAANENVSHTWGVWENMETTAVPIPTFTDTSYQMLLDSIDYPPDMEDFGKAMASPFVQMLGVIFYLFIFGVPLLMMYIRQDNMTLPTTLLLLFGSIIIFMLPPQWQIIAGALMTLGFVGILFKLYKERER